MSWKGPVGQLVKLRGGCLPPRGRLTTGLQVGNLPYKFTNRHSSPKRLSNMLMDRRRADTLSWFEKAHKDLRCAQIDLAADPPAPEDALYHCQQAAEKALKGFLVWHDQPFPKTHDLGRLGNQAVGLDQTLEPLIDEVVEVDKVCMDTDTRATS
jgi:HEPN domain-containing protein